MIPDLITAPAVFQGAVLDGFTLLLAGYVAFGGDRLVPIGRLHYVPHWLYGKYEPWIFRLVDWFLRKRFITETRPGRAFLTLLATASHFLPHGIVVPTASAAARPIPLEPPVMNTFWSAYRPCPAPVFIAPPLCIGQDNRDRYCVLRPALSAVVLENPIWFLFDGHPISCQGFYQPEIQGATVASCDGMTT